MTQEELFEAFDMNARHMLSCMIQVFGSQNLEDKTRWSSHYDKFDKVVTDLRRELLMHFELDETKLVAAFEKYNDKRRA